MAEIGRVSHSPLNFIKRCVHSRRIHWTYHVNVRLREKHIPRNLILDSVDSYEIIEEYPEDKYLPSYLVFAQHEGVVFHILIAVDVAGDNVRLVTAYYPNPDEWDPSLRYRRTSR